MAMGWTCSCCPLTRALWATGAQPLLLPAPRLFLGCAPSSAPHSHRHHCHDLQERAPKQAPPSARRDDSLETVKRNEAQYGIPLKVLSYAELYGWTMDDIVRAIGHRSNCTFCGVFRRQALDRGAALMRADKVATGAPGPPPA